MLDSADSSGLSDEKFAARSRISPQRLYYWRRKLDRKKRSSAEGQRPASAGTPRKAKRGRGSKPAGPTAIGSRSARSKSRRPRSERAAGSPNSARSKASAAQFVEVKAAALEQIEVHLRNGRLVSAPTSIAPSILAALLDAIEGAGC